MTIRRKSSAPVRRRAPAEKRTKAATPDTAAFWADDVEQLGIAAARAIAGRLRKLHKPADMFEDDPAVRELNILSMFGTAMSLEFKKALLMAALERNEFSLIDTARELAIPSGSPQLTRMIVDLGLKAFYRAGAADRPKGRPPRKS